MARVKFSAAFGTIIRQHRTHRNLSQERLAEAAGIHRNYVGNLERGEYAPTLDVAERLGQALGIPLEDLIRETRAALACGKIVLARRSRSRAR